MGNGKTSWELAGSTAVLYCVSGASSSKGPGGVLEALLRVFVNSPQECFWLSETASLLRLNHSKLKIFLNNSGLELLKSGDVM